MDPARTTDTLLFQPSKGVSRYLLCVFHNFTLICSLCILTGPLQISLGRIIVDIMKFFVIFLLVLFSFACGLNHLYWYYSRVHARDCMFGTDDQKDISCDRKYRSFSKWVWIKKWLFVCFYYRPLTMQKFPETICELIRLFKPENEKKDKR